MGDLGEICGHEIDGIDGADGDDVFVGSLVAHYADGGDGQQDGEGLGDLSVEAGGFDFVDEDFVCGSEDFEPFGRYVSDDSDGEARSGEWMAPDDVFWEAEVFADDSDFVLEQVAERLDKLEAEFCGQAADVVVELDICGGIAVFRAGFDDVGIEGALGEESGVGYFPGLGFECFDEFVADYFAFLLRVGDAGELFEELLGPVNDAEVHVKVIAECRNDALAFVLSEQAVIDKDTDELVAYGLMNQ